MTIQVTVTVENAADYHAALAALTSKGALAELPTEAIIAEARERLAKKGFAVNVEEVNTGEVKLSAPPSPPADDGNKPRRGRPTNAEVAARAAAAASGEAQPQPQGPAPALEAVATRQDVITALNAYSEARGGQVAGRQLMQAVCGVTKLMDVKPEDYGKLLTALKAA